MTTRELIAELQRADPSGNLPVIIKDGNGSPYTVNRLEWYYDGKPCIVSRRDGRWVGEMLTSGEKVAIYAIEPDVALIDHPDMEIEGPAERVDELRRNAAALAEL